MRTGGFTAVLATCGYAFLLAPLLVVCVLSFTSGQHLSFPLPGVSLRWHGALAANAEVLRAALNSLVLALIVTAVALLACPPAALAVARRQAPAWVAGPRLTTLPVALFHYAESRVNPLLAALAVTLIGITLVTVLAVDRLAGFTRTIGTT